MNNENNETTVYGADDIQKILKIGKNKVYEFLDDVYSNTHYFKVIKIGKQYRVPVKSFNEWLTGEI